MTLPLARLQRHSTLPTALRVERYQRDTQDTFTLHLRQSAPLGFVPGQFNMLYAPGYGEVPISMSGDPDDTEFVVHTIRSVGPVTRALGRVTPGESVFVRGPFGTGWPEPGSDQVVVVIAGGIGLAPLRPLIYRTLRRQLPLYVLYGARSPSDVLFGQELSAWAARSGVRCVVSVDRADLGWTGDTGVITKHIARLDIDPLRAVASVCGPEVMMRFAARELLGLGVDASRIFVSLERNMKCAIGHCGHCQLGPHLLCRTGPVLDYAAAQRLMAVAEL